MTDDQGTLTSQQRYLPFGAVRTNIGSIVQTDYGYTGQRNLDEDIGLMDYKARFYSPMLNRFIQPDTIISNFYNPQTLNRFSYVDNRPINFNDPSGHIPACTADGECNNKISTSTAIARLKVYIKFKYGIKMSDDGDKNWDIQNLSVVRQSLANIDGVLNGNLKTLVGGSTFYMGNHSPTKDNPYSKYSGWTSGTNITFYTTGSEAIRQMNIYHEFGHLIDNMSGGFRDVFTNTLLGEGKVDFIAKNGYLNQNALDSDAIYNDPNYKSVQAYQASNNGVSEQWADIFANYVAGNINLGSPEGLSMHKFVTEALEPFTRYYH